MRRRRIELGDQLFEGRRELRLVLLGMGADELDHLPVAVRGGFPFSPRFVDDAEAIVSIMHIGIALKQLARGLLGLIELAGVYEVNHGVGVAGELILLAHEGPAEVALVMAVLVPSRFDGTGGGGREGCTLGGLILL